jgi:hypothetical protein
VTFEYDSFSRTGLPVNPVIYRIRHDIEWQEFGFHNGEIQLNGKLRCVSTRK